MSRRTPRPRQEDPRAAPRRLTALAGVALAVIGAGAAASARGGLNPAATMRIDLALKVRDSGALRRLAVAGGTPGSAVFQRYLTPAEFTACFAPSGAQVAAVTGHLTRSGLDNVTEIAWNAGGGWACTLQTPHLWVGWVRRPPAARGVR